MPEQVHECVQSVLDDNPDMEESRAWAICHAQTEADTDDIDAAALDELGLETESLDALAQEADAWTRETDGDTVAWIDTDGGVVVYDDAVQQADGFGVDVYRIVQTEADGPADEGDLLGVAVDMPNAGVYVDWNIDAWPDDEQLSGAHVSDYDSLDDLEQVTAGDLEQVRSVTAEQQADLPETCRSCGEAERMDGSMVCEECADTGAEQQAVTVTGLSQEARDAIERKYNATVQEVSPDE